MRTIIRGLLVLSLALGAHAGFAADGATGAPAPAPGPMQPAQMLADLTSAHRALAAGDLASAKATLRELSDKLGAHPSSQTRYVRRRVILVQTDLLIGRRQWAEERLQQLIDDVIRMGVGPQDPPPAPPAPPAHAGPPAPPAADTRSTRPARREM